jgi:hypothetical protein
VTAPVVTQPAPPAVPPASPERRADDFTTRMIAEHGTVENALRAVSMRYFAASDAQATAERAAAELRAKLPDGSLVLPKAEAESFAKLQALGTPAEIEAKVKKAGELEAAVATTTAKEQARAAALAGQVDPDAFVDYALRTKLPIELRDMAVVENGKTVTRKVPYVRNPADDKAAFVPLTDYMGTLPAHEQRALKPSGPALVTGVEYPAQRPTSPTGTTVHPADEYLSRRFPAKQPTAAAAS